MSEYHDLAYEQLGLSHDGHEIGTMRYIDLPDDVFYAICARRLNNVRQTLYEMKHEPDWEATVRANDFLPFPEWRHILKNLRRYTLGNLNHPDWERRCNAIIEDQFLRLHRKHHYDPTFPRWQQYVCDASPDFAAYLFRRFPIRLPSDKILNAYVVASSQSGKTELLKLFAHSTITRREEALIVIEPAGDASRQVALWPECGDRLIYVDLSLDLSRAPVINPFQIYGVRAEDISPAAIDVKTVVAQQLLTAFQEVLGTGAGAELSKNMRTIIMPCLMVLLDFPGATLRDLRRFMDDTRNGDLVAFARTRHHYEDVPEFFTHGFHSKHYRETKDAVQAKLQSLFSSGKFARLTCGPSTFMLEKAIEERKIIIFNLAEGSVGEQEGSAFGRLIVAMLQGIAVRRDKQDKRIPIRVIIDEFHNFTTRSMEKIITQAAKYRLYLTMAGQQIGQVTSKEIRDAILNVSVLIGGRNAPIFHGPVASMLNVSPEDIGSLDRGDFIAHLSGVPPLQFHIKEHLLRSDHCMSEQEWERVKADQLRRYYRPIGLPAPVPEIIPPAKVGPYRQHQEIAPQPSRRRQVKAERVEITEEDII